MSQSQGFEEKVAHTNKQKKPIDLNKVKITRLPRRNDDVYMRGVRRPRA